MWAGPAAVGKDIFVVAPGFFESIGQDWHPVERPVLVNASRQADDRG
jgi:hypothetical protein